MARDFCAMKGGAGVGLPSLNGIWTWLAIVVIIWTSEIIDFRKSQQRRRRAPLWRCAYLFSKETNPKKKKKKTKKNIFQCQTCLSMSTFFSPSKQEEEDNDDDEEEDESVVVRAKRFWPSREVPTTRLSKSARDFVLLFVCFATKSKVRKILKLYFFPWYFFECFLVLRRTYCTYVFPKALNLLYASKGGLPPRRRWRRTCDTRRLSRKTRTNRRNRRILCLFGCRGRNKRIGNRWTRRAAGGGIDD